MSSNSGSPSLIFLVDLLPFQIDLYFGLSAREKRQLKASDGASWQHAVHDSVSRDLVSNPALLNTSLFSNSIESYLNGYFSKAFNGKNNSVYATFNSVVLSTIQRRQTQRSTASRNNDAQYRPNPSPLLRGLAFNSTVTSLRFKGAAIFLRDGDTSVPKPTMVQAHELGALADSDRLLLYSLQNASYASGLPIITSLSAAIISDPTNVFSPTTSPGINTSLIIGLTVGASALTVFAFLLFFIYRRNSCVSPREKITDDEKVLAKSSTVDITDNENSPSSAAPILISVKLEPTFDDNISEYTESVYSAPKRKVTKSWMNQPQDLESIKNKQDDANFYDKIDFDSCHRYPDDEYSAGTVGDASPPKITISDRFIPRYVDSPNGRNESFTSDESMDIAKQLNRAQLKQRSASAEKKMRLAEKNQDRSDYGLESTGLFPDKVVDNDIESSFLNYKELNQQTGHTEKDDATFSSLGSFSYSLEPIGDHSTTASSKVQS